MGTDDMRNPLGCIGQEILACDFCGSAEKTAVYPDLNMVRCSSCDLVYVHRRCEDEKLKEIYGEGYFHSQDSQSLGYDDYLGERERITRTFQRRLGEVVRILGHGEGKLLDVGCAAGFFMDVAREAGWDVRGVEISDYAAGHAKDRLGLEVHVGTLLDLPSPFGQFDVVTMWDYIEHSLTPKGDLEYAWNLLREGGLLVLTTPDFDSWPSRLFRQKWMGIKPHEHFFYFSRRTLRNYLNATGFRVEGIKTAGKYISVSLFAKRLSLYSPFMAKLVKRAIELSGVGQKTVFVNPHDIVVVYGRKVTQSGHKEDVSRS